MGAEAEFRETESGLVTKARSLDRCSYRVGRVGGVGLGFFSEIPFL